MGNLTHKIDWSKVVKIGSAVLAGVLTYVSTRGDQKTADKLLELESRLAILESNKVGE